MSRPSLTAAHRTLRATSLQSARQQAIRHHYHSHTAPIRVQSVKDMGHSISSRIQEQNERSRIDAMISSLPLVRYLRDWPRQMTSGRLDEPIYGETRLHSGHHESLTGRHLTAGSILGRDKLTVAPPLFIQQGAPFRAVTVCHVGTHLCGHPGYVHGGVPFFLFDDIFARCASVAFSSGVGLTANLNLDFRKPMLPGRIYVLRAEVESLEGRKLSLRGTMRALPQFDVAEMEAREAAVSDALSAEEQLGDIVAEATSLFVEPKYAESMVRLFK